MLVQLTVGSLVHPCNQRRDDSHRVGFVVRVKTEWFGHGPHRKLERVFDLLMSDGSLLERRTWKGWDSQHRVIDTEDGVYS